MGSVLSRLTFGHPGPSKDTKVLLVGLDQSGKTQMFYHWRFGEGSPSVPTVGFNVETIRYKDKKFTCWDLGGGASVRKFWIYYLLDTDGIIFVVDSNDPDRIGEAKSALHGLLGNDLIKEVPFLILANKQDLPDSLTPEEVETLLELEEFWVKRPIRVFPSVYSQPEDTYEALDWLLSDYHGLIPRKSAVIHS